MLIFNTTYHVEESQEKYFLIWMQEYYLDKVVGFPTLMEVLV